ncbi:hypothetical protein [Sphingomonas sp. RT2P30]|uniref:hypothetical protein n=1 Tax=Parasphingomonas halimpatiens TaxID=3096162 RepID=UPI002FC8384F
MHRLVAPRANLASIRTVVDQRIANCDLQSCLFQEISMRSLIFTLSLLLLPPEAFAQTSAPANSAGSRDPKDIVCKKEAVTGSYARYIKICKTRAQWEGRHSPSEDEAVQADAYQLMDRGRINSCNPAC